MNWELIMAVFFTVFGFSMALAALWYINPAWLAVGAGMFIGAVGIAELQEELR